MSTHINNFYLLLVCYFPFAGLSFHSYSICPIVLATGENNASMPVLVLEKLTHFLFAGNQILIFLQKINSDSEAYMEPIKMWMVPLFFNHTL